MVESNALFNYHAFLKMITTIPSIKKCTVSRSSFFFPDEEYTIPDNLTTAYFTNLTTKGQKLMTNIKEGSLSMTAPLFLDITSIDSYILDKVDIRLRLELANKNWIINTDQDGSKFSLKIKKAKLWIDRVIPYEAALTSLYNSLMLKPVEYTYNRTLYKTHVLGLGQSSLICELPFSQIIPNNVIMCIVSMDAFNGHFKRNPLYLSHGDLSHVNITINGSIIYNLNMDFPNKYSTFYYTSIDSLGINSDHNLTY